MPTAPALHVPIDSVRRHGAAPHAEAVLEAGTATIHLWLPEIDMADLEVVAGRWSLRLRSRRQPEAFDVGLVLPFEAVAGPFVARYQNGVIEIRLLVPTSR